MSQFNPNNADFYSTLTHIAKVASSPIMFGERWAFLGLWKHDYDPRFSDIHIQRNGVVFCVRWDDQDRKFRVWGDSETEHIAKCFEARLNGLKRDEKGNVE